MAVVGFGFTSISASRGKPYRGSVNINNNVSVTSIEEAKLSGANNALRFGFEFTTRYDPEIGSITLQGSVLYLAGERSKQILKDWKNTKKLPNDIAPEILNTILSKANIEALMLSKELNLPPPIPMPRVSNQPNQSSDIKKVENKSLKDKSKETKK